MKARTVERYRVQLTGAIAELPVRHARRHDAITRELGTFASYQRWTETMRVEWHGVQPPEPRSEPRKA